jgi:2-keto-4-pentenoate hydratase
MNPLPSAPRPLVDALVAARRTGVRARAQLEPIDRLSAYATQQAVAAALGASVNGWKVGMLADGTPTVAPMFAGDMRASGARWELPAQGALVIEVEVAMRLGADLPVRPGKAYSRADVMAAVAEVLVGVELLQSRFAGDAFPPLPLHLADNLGNAGYVSGGATPDFASRDLAQLRCRYTLDGVETHDAVGGHPQSDPWLPLIASLNEGIMGLGGFRAGQVITTGSLTKPAQMRAPAKLVATLDGIGAVEVNFVR